MNNQLARGKACSLILQGSSPAGLPAERFLLEQISLITAPSFKKTLHFRNIIPSFKETLK